MSELWIPGEEENRPKLPPPSPIMTVFLQTKGSVGAMEHMLRLNEFQYTPKLLELLRSLRANFERLATQFEGIAGDGQLEEKRQIQNLRQRAQAMAEGRALDGNN